MNDWPAKAYLYAWPESDRLKHALTEASFDRVFTTPVLRHEQLLCDGMIEAVEVLKGKKLQRSAVTQDKEGLKCLIRQGHLRAALNLTTKILQSMNHVSNAPIRRTACTVESLEIWSCRFQLFMALELHKPMLEEATAFHEFDAPDLYFQHRSKYRRLNYAGSVVPFQLRLIHAELPRFSDEPGHALTRVSRLEEETLQVLESMENADHKDAWARRLRAVRMTKAREQRHAISVYEGLLEKTDDPNLERPLRLQLVRIAMVIGHSSLLENFASTFKGNDPWFYIIKGLCAVFSANYQKGLDCFTAQTTVTNRRQLLNNQSICNLYTSRVKEAVAELLACDEPCLPMMLNLYTIGELVSTNSGELRNQHFTKHCESLPDTFDPVKLRVLKG